MIPHSQKATLVTAEQVIMQPALAYLSEEVQQEIQQRVKTLTRVSETAAPAEKAAGLQALLVMRPGTIPRPIDPFFFEISNHSTNVHSSTK